MCPCLKISGKTQIGEPRGTELNAFTCHALGLPPIERLVLATEGRCAKCFRVFVTASHFQASACFRECQT